MKLLLALLFLITCTIYNFSQNLRSNYVVLDLTERNKEETDGNLFSIEHALIIAGTPYSITTEIEEAITNKIIICSSDIRDSTFNPSEKQELIKFVKNGGILFLTQLKDPELYELAGVSSYSYSSGRHSFNWNIENIGKAGEHISDVNDKKLILADTSFTSSFGTRSYQLTSAEPLAFFDDNTVAFSKNSYYNGYTYLLGINWQDIVLRNHVTRHFKANRTYSNGYEPGSDILCFFLRGLMKEHLPYGVYKHTSIQNSEALVVITHDVDATSAIKDIMTDFSSYEFENNIRSTYFITTHYMHDSVAKDFWNGYTEEIISVKNKKHEIASHSVSHVPDFDKSNIVSLGQCGSENQFNYQPFYNGVFSENVTVCGEANVSKKLLDNSVGVNVQSFRSGYLAYNKSILEALEFTGYTFNSSHSANNVLTNFPFYGHLDLSLKSRVSEILEIPNTISDVFMDERISEENYMKKVEIWKEVQAKNAKTNSPTILLIHPNRNWKIIAEQSFVSNLSKNTAIIPFEEYGYYWKDRMETQINFSLQEDSTLRITLNKHKDSINPKLSFIVTNGKDLSKIELKDVYNNTISFQKENFKENDLLLYLSDFNEKYTDFTYEIRNDFRSFSVYPNPTASITNIEFELLEDAYLRFEIYDITGKKIITPYDSHFELGKYKLPLETNALKDGIYYYTMYFNNNQKMKGKILVNH